MSNTDLIVKNTGQSELNTLPSSGGVRCGDMKHHDVLLCSVIDMNGKGTLVSVSFSYHWVNVLHSNYATVYFIQIVNEIRCG